MNKNSFKKIYNNLPPYLQTIAKTIWEISKYIPFTSNNKREKWIRHVYEKFALEQRRHILLSCSRYCFINRPINGYYFEFGCHEANTMRLAWDTFKWLFDWKYIAFDSFEGLPEIQEIDKMEIWKKGKLKTTEEEFIKIVTRYGMPIKKLITAKGFYNESLNDNLKQKLLPTKAAIIYIDCDLYASTVLVLEFCKDFLQVGTIIVFDDWNCFYGDPERGERKAFAEFRAKYPQLIFEEFVATNEAKSFIFLGEK